MATQQCHGANAARHNINISRQSFETLTSSGRCNAPFRGLPHPSRYQGEEPPGTGTTKRSARLGCGIQKNVW
ncbi:hypothetical protein V5799_025135 [Amblyomma americanum]|uniref:Uncharacterized protein n=1 Tax=Amblyomma americanum TaxID=6943 RepID=A0AAQ4EAL6_AMBAM